MDVVLEHVCVCVYICMYMYVCVHKCEQLKILEVMKTNKTLTIKHPKNRKIQNGCLNKCVHKSMTAAQLIS